jgi:hypothetical protein
VKRRIQDQFFKGDRRVQAEVVYIGNESLRDKLRKQERVKIELRDPAGVMVTILADAKNLIAA